MRKHLPLAALAVVLPMVALAQPMPSSEEIHQLLATRVDGQKWATGMVVGLVTSKGRQVIAYGSAAKGGGDKVDADTVWDIGSITKVLTALALADMAQHDELVLEDPVARYLPPGTVLPQNGPHQITLIDLATHTSGLPLRPSNLVSQDPDNSYAGYADTDLYRFLAGYKPPRTIGSTYDYSNVGFGLLGVALARCAGTDYDSLIARRILLPLGMKDTVRDPPSGATARIASGFSYDIEAAELAPAKHWDFGSGVAGAGGYRSTANDLMTFIEAALGYRASTLAPAFAAMTRTRRPGGMTPADSIALAWNILDADGREIVWKNGSVGGFRSFIGYDATARTGVVALANAQSAAGADDIALHILDPKLPVDMHIPRKHVVVTLDPQMLESYTGRYRYSKDDILVVTREGAHLYGKESGQDRFELLPEGPRDFFLKIVDAQITFETGSDGKVTAALWHQGGQDQRGTRLR